MLRIIITKAISLDYYNLVLLVYIQEETGKHLQEALKTLCSQCSTVHFAIHPLKTNKEKQKS